MTSDTTVSTDITKNDAIRDIIRQSLSKITAELNSALVAAGLAYPIYLCVPTTGDALVTFACPLDPNNDEEWDRITQIVREIVGKEIGSTRLTARALCCSMAGTTMAAADVTVE
jgi:hypothetical protein